MESSESRLANIVDLRRTYIRFQTEDANRAVLVDAGQQLIVVVDVEADDTCFL